MIWGSYKELGKKDYIISNVQESNMTWIYKFDEFQQVLNEEICGQKLVKLYIDLNGYYESYGNEDNYIDLTYFGGPLLFVLETTCLVIDVYGEGVIKYKIFPMSDFTSRKVHDFLPEDMLMNYQYYYDASEHFKLKYENLLIKKINVVSTNTWFSTVRGFDKAKAESSANAGELPNEIYFYLENGMKLCVRADYLENYTVELCKGN